MSAANIQSILDEYAFSQQNKQSKAIESHHFGYRRMKIERPVRLTYQMSLDRKTCFLDAFPRLLDEDARLGYILVGKDYDRLTNSPNAITFRQALRDHRPDIAKQLIGNLRIEINQLP